MDLREVVEKYKQFKVPSLSTICEKAKQHSKICLFAIIVLFIVFVYLVQQIPHWQVAQFEISNSSEVATLENQYRATLAQILGGTAVGIGIYFAWGNLTTAREGQITDRFTRAVEHLGATDMSGNPAIEIRLGGIYALERIANESERDYWPIMEILTAYIRKNTSVGIVEKQENESIRGEFLEPKEISLEIQAILSVIGKRRYSYNNGEYSFLNLSMIHLEWADLNSSHFEYADISGAYLEYADLGGIRLEGAALVSSHLEFADIHHAHLENAGLAFAHLEWTDLSNSHLEGAYLRDAHFQGADFSNSHLEGAYFHEADLMGVKNLTFDQLSKVKTLYNAKLDSNLENELRAKGYSYLLDDEP